MIGLLGKTVGMTQIFGENGEIIPVTVIESGPCGILQIKTTEKDGYSAIQLGFEDIKEARLSKPLVGKFKKAKLATKRFIKEIRVDNPQDFKLGQQIDVTQFSPGDFVDVVSTSKGRGFQGGIKRWHWSLGPKSHGSMSHREPGSIGASAYPSRVFKGQHMPGHMGNARCTVQNLEVTSIDKDNNLLVLKGSVPGHKNGYLIIRKTKKNKPARPPKVKQEQKATEQAPADRSKKSAKAKGAKK